MYKSLLWAAGIGLISACNPFSHEDTEDSYEYKYSGIIPCADCEGIEIQIAFDKPDSDSLVALRSTTYHGTINGSQVFSEMVPVVIDSNWRTYDTVKASVVLIAFPNDSTLTKYYRWNEERIEMLSKDGLPIKTVLNNFLFREESEGTSEG